MSENLAGLMSLFAQDTWSGKTSPEPCPQTKEKTSAASSKKPSKSSKKMPIYLDLQRAGGLIPGASWETGIQLPGRYMTHSTGAFRSEGNESVYWPTSMDIPQETSCLRLNTGEHPREANPTLLSQVLEQETDPKYELSARACQGILNRANKRGKELPEILKTALESQAKYDE